MNEELNELSGKILKCAIEVHKYLGPGLLESIYEQCLCKEFDLNNINYRKQLLIPIIYKGELLNHKFKIDIMTEEKIIIEIKAIESILPVHKAQLLSYLRLTKIKLGLLINFNVPQLIKGFQRIIN